MKLIPIPFDADLAGKVVQLRQSFFKEGIKAEEEHFRCHGGFGCEPGKIGNSVFGVFLSDGEQGRIHRSDVEFFVECD